MHELEEYGLMVMKSGRVVEQGLTDQVLDDPQHGYTSFLSALSCRCEMIEISNLSKSFTLHNQGGAEIPVMAEADRAAYRQA